MPYIGTSPSNGVRRVHTYTATASQTTFSGASSEGITLSYVDANYLDVFQNGVLLGSADYTSTSGTSVVLAQGASADDLIVIVVYDVFSVADTVSKSSGGSFDSAVTMSGGISGNTSISGDLTIPDKIIHDGDTNTAIRFPSADTVTIETGGSERARVSSGGVLTVGKTDQTANVAGTEIEGTGTIVSTRDGNTNMFLNRKTSFGNLMEFRKDNSAVGFINTPFTEEMIFGASGTNSNGVLMSSANQLRPCKNGSTSDNTQDLGASNGRWNDVFATNGTIQTSDQQEKNTITDSDLGLDFVKRLSPKSYIFNGKTRTHYGLIAQDVETVLGDINKPTSEFAGFIKDDISEEQDGSSYRYGLRYTEFVAPLIKAIKEQQTIIEDLQARITALENAE